MDCKIVLRHRTGLHCTVHQADSMAAICGVAEQGLRDRIAALTLEVVEQDAEIAALRAELKFVSGP